MIHAENSDMISLITERLEQRGLTEPYYHAISRPQLAEGEATYRAISMSELTDVPILLVHVSSKIAMDHIRDAQTRLLPIHGETCPHYLYLLSDAMKGPDFEGAKHVCSPPLRHDPKDLDAIWSGVANGTFTTLSSDHAPTKFDGPYGKKVGLIDGKPVFSKIPNGLPGIETRIPLLFDGAIGHNPKISLPRFVQVTSSQPAALYGLGGVKGNVAPGYDADLVVWYPSGHEFSRTHGDSSGPHGVTITVSELHHDVDYTPFEGVTVQNWPRYTILRGQVVWNRDHGGIVGKKGQGNFLKRKPGTVVQGRHPASAPARGMLAGEREIWA
jgi:dihydropyrimidinase